MVVKEVPHNATREITPFEPKITLLGSISPETPKQTMDDIYARMDKEIGNGSLWIMFDDPSNKGTRKRETVNTADGVALHAQVQWPIVKRDNAIVVFDGKTERVIHLLVLRSIKANLVAHIIKKTMPPLPKAPKPHIIDPDKPAQIKKPFHFGPGRPRLGVPKQIQKPKEKKKSALEIQREIIKSYTLNGKPVAEMNRKDRTKSYKKLKLSTKEARVFEFMRQRLKVTITDKEIAEKVGLKSASMRSVTERIIRKFLAKGAKPLEKKPGQARFSRNM